LKKVAPAICFFLIFFACTSGDEASMILQVIREGAGFAEKHDIRALMEYATPDFKAQPGDHGPKAVRGILFRAFQYYGNFKIYYPRPLVDIGEPKTTAVATVYFVILRKDYVLPDLKALYDDPEGWIAAVGKKADIYELELTLTKKNSRWKVRQARINPLKGMPS